MKLSSDIGVNSLPEIRGYTEDYRELLDDYGLQYLDDGYYLLVGTPKRVQGWMLNLSIIQSQAFDLLNLLIPELLLANGISFKIPKNKKAVSAICGANIPYTQLGKVITIFAEEDDQIVALSKRLIELTKFFRGPAIPTDYCLGGIIYTRYGAVNPVIGKSQSGESVNLIYNQKMELVRDIYSVPFALPKNVRWPFNVKIQPPQGISNFMNGNYLITGVFKTDVKGDVYKAIRVTRYIPEWCIIKEAKHDMCSDDSGRDVQERLRWQYSLLSSLVNDMPVPKPYGLFEEDGNTYLAMQLIKGVALKQLLEELFAGKTWMDLDFFIKRRIVGYLIEIVGLIAELHERGLVHRDITPANFIVNSKGRIVMIDLELAYSLNDNYPSPPFKLGTPGYMSSEQLQSLMPTPKEDIYNIGGLMIKMLTSIAPSKLGVSNLDLLAENLTFFIGSEDVVGMIVQCLDPAPVKRPDVHSIKQCLNDFSVKLVESQSKVLGLHLTEDKKVIDVVIVQAIKTLVGALTTFPGKLNYSLHVEDLQIGDVRAGLFSGIAGPLYLLSNIVKAGFQIENLQSTYEANCACLTRNSFLSTLDGGLDGAAGVAMSLASGVESSLLDDSDILRDEIKNLLLIKSEDLTLFFGASGQGMGVLKCLSFLKDNRLEQVLCHNVQSILGCQSARGAWKHQEGANANGLYYGDAGIISFLLEYFQVNGCRDGVLEQAIIRGMDNLTKSMKIVKGNTVWPIVNNSNVWSSWLAEGNLGVVQTYIRAYMVFKNPVYKSVAERALLQYPRCIVNSSHAYSFGVSGLGLVYLDAYNAFGDKEWQDRADWIASYLTRTCFVDDSGGHFWVSDGSREASLNVADGLSGVLQFLLRWRYPSKFKFL